jgi:cell division protein FtsZ
MSAPAEKTLQSTKSEISNIVHHKARHCRIAVIGVGDVGNNAIDRLIGMGGLDAECIAINTDRLHLNAIRAAQKILIGEKTCRGSGSGGDPRVGRAAIEESRRQIEDILSNVDVVFVAAGLGGGTGTGAAPTVAEIARRNGAVVIGVVTMPLEVERSGIECATRGLAEMRRQCDTVVVIDHRRLRNLVPQLPLKEEEAFEVADQMLASTIDEIVETISGPSLIDLDFSNFEAIVRKGGVAAVGVGESDAPNRVEEAVRNAFKSSLLSGDCAGASGALIHVTGDDKMTVEEANRVGEIVAEMMRNNALVSWSAKVNPSLPGILKVTLVMTGIHSPYLQGGFSMIAPDLYEMDHQAEPEKPLHINLDLYQLEDFE